MWRRTPWPLPARGLVSTAPAPCGGNCGAPYNRLAYSHEERRKAHRWVLFVRTTLGADEHYAQGELAPRRATSRGAARWLWWSCTGGAPAHP